MSAVANVGRKKLLSAGAVGSESSALARRFAVVSDRPKLKSTLIVRRQVQMGEVSWIVKIPDTGKLYVLDDAGWGILELFDGTRTHEEILAEYPERHDGAVLDLKIIVEYEDFARKMELLEQTASEKSLGVLYKYTKDARRRAAEEKAEGFNVFFLLLNLWDPNKFLDRTQKYVRWFWTPPAVAVAAIGWIYATWIFAQHFEQLFRETIELYAFLGRPFWDILHFWFIVSIIGFIHEMGHAYSTKIYGGEVHEVGVALLYFMPAFYTDTTDSLLFTKWQRLWVNLAGVYLEGTLCVVATMVWVAAYPDTLLHELAYKTMLYTGISTVFFNANPLIKIDGYHALTSMIEVPELREESIAYLGALFQRYILRLPVEVPTLPERKKRFFLIYGPFALLYTGVIMYFIGHLFFNFYSKYFPNFVYLILAITMYKMFRKRVRLCTRVARLFYLDKKELLMSKRARGPLLIAGAAILLLLALPLTRRSIQEPVSLRPAKRLTLAAPDDARVAEVTVSEGSAIRPGQVLLRLTSPVREARVTELAAEEDRLVHDVGRLRQIGDAHAAADASSELEAARSALATERRLQTFLEVKSPIAGHVLTSRPGDLVGRTVKPGDPLLEVADDATMEAEIPVTERLMRDLTLGQPITLRVHGRPIEVRRGSLAAISAATSELPATDRGGATVAISEKPARFLAIARFDNADRALLPGMSGRARILLKRTPYLVRGWRILRNWVQTVVW